jgi:hypothetical protein
VRVGAQVGAREKLRVAGWLWARTEQQITGGANGGWQRVAGLLGRGGNEAGGSYARWRVDAVSPHLCGLQELQHGRGVVPTSGGAGGQWRMAVRPPMSAHRPRGTNLSSLRVSLSLDAQWC